MLRLYIISNDSLVDSKFLGELDLAGCTCKMVIEKDLQFGILITQSDPEEPVTTLNAQSFADQKHWYSLCVLIKRI